MVVLINQLQRYLISMSIDVSGRGKMKLSHVFRVKWAPYRAETIQRGRLLFWDSHCDPGLILSAGPRGPSSAIPAKCPCWRASRVYLMLLAPWLLEPRVRTQPILWARVANISPSPDSEIKACTPQFLNAAVAASRSRCHIPRIPGEKESGVLSLMRKLFIQRLAKKSASLTLKGCLVML